MANDCWNRVEITGDSDTLSKLKERFDALTSGFLTTSTYQSMFEGNTTGNNRDFTDVDWGSKRLDCSSYELEDGKITFAGDSAWAPPMEFYQMLSEDWDVKVEVWYDERGMDFAGHVVFESGDTEVEEEWTYWENLYLNDRNQFEEELLDSAGWMDNFEEFVETLSLDKWQTKTDVDLSTYEKMFEESQSQSE
jgi:hypothetical protein